MQEYVLSITEAEFCTCTVIIMKTAKHSGSC